jgi:flagellar biosynthesis/type III secretory pathway protein FliH
MRTLANATMLYRKGTEGRIHGVHVDTIVVDATEVEDHLAQGWHRTPADVKLALDARSTQDDAQAQLDRAREEGARAAREEAERLAFEEALQRAREEGARVVRVGFAAVAAGNASKKGADKQQSNQK